MGQCGDCGQPVTDEQAFCTNCGGKNPAGPPPRGLGSDSTRTHMPWKPGSLGANLDSVFSADACGHCGEVHPKGTRYCPQTGNLTISARSGPAADDDTVSKEETRVFHHPTPSRAAAHRTPTSSSSSAGAAYLIVHRGSGTPHREKLEIGQEITVGKDRQPRVIAFPQDHYLSPRHARFYWQGNALMVEDLDTLNKIFRRVTEEAELFEGDRIRIGNHVFRFELVHRTAEEMQELTKANEQRGVLILGTKGDEARARLIIRLDTGLRGKEYFIARNAIVIGREKGTHNFRRDKKISRRHAKITPKDDGRFILEDLSSRFGTWLQIHSPYRVADGDEFLMGNQRIAIENRV